MKKILSILIIGLFTFTSLVAAEEAIDEVSLEDVSAISSNTTIDSGYYACISLAVSDREDAYMSRWNTYSSSLVSAYIARKNSLVSVWSSADKEIIKKGVNEAAKIFKESLSQAKKEWVESEKEIISKMKEDREECQNKYGIVPPSSQKNKISNNNIRANLMKQIQEMLKKRSNISNKPIKLNAR